jgi:Protein of unknown function (DUF3455)
MNHSFYHRFTQLLCATTASAALGACGAGDTDDTHVGDLTTEQVATLGAELGLRCAPTVDPAIAVPAGHRLVLTLDALGVQLYACQATATGFSWVFQAPEATLLNARGRVVGSHYAGPTWEYQDDSKVMAARLAGVSPDPSSIPWLLLQASGHENSGRMANVTYIQRLDTVGGLAPAAATCTANNVGETARVDYAATYHFFEAGRLPCHCH